ncbi:conserved exported protein of unknown function [Rhodovastum atsumiense]|nr:conserved exported protein of unknown function [Rhodovastum atsumiense]
MPVGRSRELCCVLSLWILLCIAAAFPARAHRQGSSAPAPEDAISIPTVTHGEMLVLAAYRRAILALAQQQFPTDRVMRRLQGFINIQFSACLWGLAPGSLTDEDSPFNECAHAYLAATRALLLHLLDMPGDRTAVQAVVAEIEDAMQARQASLMLCRYSGEAFNTSDVIYPDWRGLLPCTPGLIVLAVLALAVLRSASARPCRFDRQ